MSLKNKVDNSDVVEVELLDETVFVAERHGSYKVYKSFLNGYLSSSLTEHGLAELESRADNYKPVSLSAL